MRRVGYDGQAFLSPNGGTGKGLQLRNLLGPFVHTFTGFASNAPNTSGLPLVQEGAAGYNAWQQLSLPASLRRHRIDLFLAPYNVAPFFLPRGVQLLLVLHDTIHLKGFRKPDLRGRLMDRYRRFQIPASVARASIVLTVSEHARGEILAIFPRANVRVIPCAVPHAWFAPRPLSEREDYLLMVTSSAPHKNAEGAVTAYLRYAHKAGRAAIPLKIVGLSREAAAYRAKLAQDELSTLIHFLPFVSERELISLYQNAAASLFPSFAEGFGIPILEAMATGTPMIAARATSLPEVGGDAAWYFDPHSADAMAAAIEKVLSSEILREQMAEKGIRRANFYHPDVIGQQVIEFWEEIAGIAAPEVTPCSGSRVISHAK
jgi:glycosyltransferase involved in cell wall biosynthesis